MIISINQPAYLPWLGYFNRIIKSDLHVVLDHVQFEKNSFTNRNKILLNKQVLWLTIPILTKGQFNNLNINTVKMDITNWRKKHWLSIKQAYSKSLFWSSFYEQLENIYIYKYDVLNEFLKSFLGFFLQYMEINTSIEYSSNYHFHEKKSDLVLEICKKFNATKYISGPLGKNYLEEYKFFKSDIEIVYDNYVHPIYPQISDKFIYNMSIIDLMANCGKKSLEILKNA